MTTRTVNKEDRVEIRGDIGARIAMARREQRWGQRDLAMVMHDQTGDAVWTYNKVSKIERGLEAVDADVLTLIAEIQDKPIEWYFETAKIRVRNL